MHFRYKDGGLRSPEDVIFKRKDKAKQWLVAKQSLDKEIRWYHKEILVVRLKEDDAKVTDKTENKKNLAYSIEDDIGGLLGLFNS